MVAEKELNYELVLEAAKVFGTLSECAAVCGVSETTIKRHAANDPKFKEMWDRGQEMCKLDLRRIGFRHARGFGPAAVTAWIHLSKHVLGYTEKSLVEVTGTIQHEFSQQRASDLLCAGFDPRCLTPAEAGEMQDLCDALDEAGSLRTISPTQRRRLLDLVEKGAGSNIIEAEFSEVTPQLSAPAEQVESQRTNADSSESGAQ